MSEADEGPQIGPIEVRMLPRMRVARCFFHGATSELAPAIATVEAAARLRGVGPVGVVIVVFPEQVQARVDAGGGMVIPRLHAEVRVPVSNTAALVPGDVDVEFVRVDRVRAACRMYSGEAGGALRAAQEGIFAWMDDAGLPRHGTRHHHAYMPNVRPGEISIELRVPIAKKVLSRA